MLTSLTDEGHATWTCPHCATEQAAHISHSKMEWTPREHIDNVKTRFLSQGKSDEEAEALAQAAMAAMSNMIALPPCQCGTRTFLTAEFQEDHLAVLLHPIGHPQEGQPTASHAAALRHMQLAKQMALIGKAKP